MGIETLVHGFARGKFEQRLDVQCKGRNGYFWPFGFTITRVRTASNLGPYIMIDIEGSKSWNGADSPISIRLGREDMQLLRSALEQLDALERAAKEVTE